MLIWIAIATLAAGVAVLLFAPVLKARRANPAIRTDADQVVFRDQLEELQRDVVAGHVPANEASAIRAEIARRILNAGSDKANPQGPRDASRTVAVLFAAMVPALALLAYGKFGAPQINDLPLGPRLAAAAKNDDMSAMVRVVELRLQKNPDDLRGWQVIAPIYARMSRFADAATAYQHLLRLGEVSAENYASLSESLFLGNGGIATTLAVNAAAEALKLDPAHIKARFYDALGTQQAGRIDDALKKYRGLLADTQPGTPLRAIVEQEIASLSGAPALTDEQIADVTSLPQGEQREMIMSMVNGLEERLKADGNNVQGWMRLIRARMVLGEMEKAQSALQSARSVLASEPESISAIDALAKELNIQ